MSGVLPALAEVLWLVLPVTLGGLTHVVAIKKNVLPGLAKLRLDLGVRVRGRALFGANKTFRGALVMIGATIAWTAIIDLFKPAGRYIPPAELSSIAYGALLGLGYIVGELPNSFVKRQLGVDPGEPAPGGLRRTFWLVDQVDSALGIVVVLMPWRTPSVLFVVLLLLVTTLIHPAVAALMVALGLKRRVG